MITRPNTNKQRLKRHKRVRAKISGTPETPRLNVFRSEANIYAQVIDDVNGVTLASASSLDKAIEGYGGNVAAATAVLLGKMDTHQTGLAQLLVDFPVKAVFVHPFVARLNLIFGELSYHVADHDLLFCELEHFLLAPFQTNF